MVYQLPHHFQVQFQVTVRKVDHDIEVLKYFSIYNQALLTIIKRFKVMEAEENISMVVFFKRNT